MAPERQDVRWGALLAGKLGRSSNSANHKGYYAATQHNSLAIVIAGYATVLVFPAKDAGSLDFGWGNMSCGKLFDLHMACV
jgi:hypothetical protein